MDNPYKSNHFSPQKSERKTDTGFKRIFFSGLHFILIIAFLVGYTVYDYYDTPNKSEYPIELEAVIAIILFTAFIPFITAVFLWVIPGMRKRPFWQRLILGIYVYACWIIVGPYIVG